MNAIEVSAREVENVDAVRVRIDPLSALTKAWNALVKKIEDRRTLHKLYQLDAHVLRDMGFDPDAIYSAHESAIGDMSALRRCNL